MLPFLNQNKNLFTFLFFLFFLLLGFTIFSDYGISIDEDNTRINGLASLKYIFEIFNPSLLVSSNKLNEIISLHEFKEQGIGVLFDLPTGFLEYMLNITDVREYFLLRHFVNFIFFIIASYFFFLLIKERYQSYIFGLVGVVFLILSPRIFAGSFYNNKDLVFLSMYIISLYFAINFLKKNTVKSAVYASLFSALLIDIRILGVIVPIIIFIFHFVNFFETNKKKINNLLPILIFAFLTPIFIITFWPFLWENPLDNFIFVFKRLSNFNEYIYNFYLGEHVFAQNIPWHYPIVWIGITTPLLYTVLFFIGAIFILKRLFYRLHQIEKNPKRKFWENENEMQDLIFFTSFFTPLIIVIFLNSSLYDGWRHLYFIYPSFLLISICGLNVIKKTFFKKNIKLSLIFLILLLFPTFLWMIKNHPYQYVYFNVLAGKNFNKSFDMDYWGISNTNALQYIANNENQKIIVGNIGSSDLSLSRNFLPMKQRNKILISDNLEKSDYLINNYRNWLGKEVQIPKNFKIFYEIKIDDVPINTIYKKVK